MIVTIDGPAGAGKSSVARALARRLGFRFLDTGAMYRTVALAGLRRGVDWEQPDWLARVAREVELQVRAERILLDGEDVTEAIRTSEVTAVTRYAADNPQVREQLGLLQRRFARGADVVTEGRDQGTVVFPDAECKVFLTASPEERARRRLRDLELQGESPTFEEVLAAQQRRDLEDAGRPVGALVKAADAVEVGTDGMSFDEVVSRLAEIVERRGNAVAE
jgi:cytidylate kinase/pantoate ligase/cytidylate kinase